jgi:hypothetical protein
MAMTAPYPPETNNLSSVAFGGAGCTRELPSEPSEISSALRTKAVLLSPSASTAIFFFLSSASDLIFLLPGLISSTRSCSRTASARARGGTLTSVRTTARSACLRSNAVSALALSPLVTILMRSRELLFLSTAASLAAKRASRLLPSPTANTRVSEFFSQVRPPHATTRTVRINVSAANSSTCRRLVLTTCERGFPAFGVGTSALMAHTRDQQGQFRGRAAERPARS